MTMQEAINQIILEKFYIEEIPGSDNTVKAFDMAIDALRQTNSDRCKICKRINNIRLFEYYCPKCGSKMVEVKQ